MQNLMIPAGILLLTGVLPSQDDPRPKADKAPAEARMEALIDEVKAVWAAWRADAQKQRENAEKGDGKPVRAMRMSPDFSEMMPKFEAAAEEFVGTEDAVQFLAWLIQHGSGTDTGKNALATLGATHAASPEIGRIVDMMPVLGQMYGEGGEAFVSAIRKSNRDPKVVGWMRFIDLGDTIDSAPTESDEYRDAKQELAQAVKAAKDERLTRKLAEKISLRESLGVGSVAPEIAGVDLDGVEFKLSDYKGKIVFLDFWGDW